MKYFKVEISAESKAEADKIIDSLLAKKLVTGGQFIASPARFLWKGEIANMEYITVASFTVDSHKEAIIADVKANSREEVPMVSFFQLEGNEELLNWINQTVS